MTVENVFTKPRPGNAIEQVGVAANVHVYQGHMASFNATGYAVAATSAGNPVVGVYDSEADNTGGANAAKKVDIRTMEVHRIKNSATDAVDITNGASFGKPCFVEDSVHVCSDSAKAFAGIVVGGESGFVWVLFVPFLAAFRASESQVDIQAEEQAFTTGTPFAISETKSVYPIAGDGQAETVAEEDIPDGEFDGQVIRMFHTSDANTITWEANAKLALAGGVSFTGRENSLLSLMWMDSLWVEVSRSDNRTS